MTPLSFLIPMLLTGIVCERSPFDPYIAETRIFVDAKALSNYVDLFGYNRDFAKYEMKQDIDVFLIQVNAYMKQLWQYKISIEVRAEVVIQPEEVFFKEKNLTFGTYYEKPYLVFNKALPIFKEWLMNDTETYDVNILWTGHPMAYVKKSGKVKLFDRVARKKGVCHKGNALAMVYYDGTQRTAWNTAKSILKIISKHFNKCNIQPEEKFIYKCNVTAVGSDLNRAKCLVNETTTAKEIDDYNFNEKSDIFDWENVCDRTLANAKEYKHKGPYKYGKYIPIYRNHNKCKLLHCSYLNHGRYVKGVPTEGMVCDFGRNCRKSKCW